MLEKRITFNKKIGTTLALAAISIPAITQVSQNINQNKITAHADETNTQTVYVNVVDQSTGKLVNQDVLTLSPSTNGSYNVKDTKGIFNGNVPGNNGNIDLSALLSNSLTSSRNNNNNSAYDQFIFGSNKEYMLPGTKLDGSRNKETAQVGKDANGNITLTFDVVPNAYKNNTGETPTSVASSTNQTNSAAPTSSASDSHITVSSATNVTPASSAISGMTTQNGNSSSADATITPDGQTGHDVANPSSVEPPMSNASSAVPTSQASSAASTSQASSAAPTSQTSSATPTSQASSATPTSQANSAAPTSQASSAAPDVAGTTAGSTTATAKQAAQIQWFHGMDPLTDKPLKDESPAQQQKAKAYMDALNKGETPEQAKKDAGVTTDDATNAEKKANEQSSNPVQSNDGTSTSSTTKQNSPASDGTSTSGSTTSTSNSPLSDGDTTETTTTSNGLAQTADHNKASVGAVLGIGTASIMTMLSAAGTLRKRI